MVYLHKGGKLLKEFKKKYGSPIKVTYYPKSDKGHAHTTYHFKGKRWVGCDKTGEMAWNDKKNLFNTKKKD